MLGELGYLDGRIRRLRSTLGCLIAVLLLPPWGRAAAGVRAMIAVVFLAGYRHDAIFPLLRSSGG